MNKTQNSDDAIHELEKTQSIEILDNEIDEEEYRQIIETFRQTKSEFIKEMKERGYSEFMMGTLIGMVIMQEGGKLKGQRNWIPSFLRK